MTAKPAAEMAASIDVQVVKHPFAVERQHHALEAGLSIAAIIAQVQPDSLLARHAHVYLDGSYIPPKLWPRLKPKPGTRLTIRMVPMGGGGGKNPLRTVLSMAIMAASPMITAGLSGYLGAAQASFLGVSGSRLLTTGINLLGRLALNALAPPGKARFASGAKESPTLFIQAARNQAQPFGRVPKVLGKHRFVPPLGALPYTETLGNDQYLRMLFIWGYGPLHITDLKIGETPLSEFDGVEIETRHGYENDAPISLYSNSVLQNDLDINLRQSDGYVLRTTEADADEISVDVTLPKGLLQFSKSGTKKSASVHVEIQYSPAGANNWSAPAEGYKSIAAQTITGISRPAAYEVPGATYEVIRIDRIVLDPASGAARLITGAEFRNGIDSGAAEASAIPAGFLALAKIERRSGDTALIPAGRITDERTATVFENSGDFLASVGSIDEMDIAAGGLNFPGLELTGKQSAALRKCISFHVPKGQYDVRLRRITADAVDDNTFDETHWTALRIKATDQLNGVVDRFNGVVHSILPDWNGTAWVEQVTSNPASLFRHVLQGRGNARPLEEARLNLDRIEAWHGACADAGREFNAVIDYDVSVHEVLHDIAAAGRASPTLLDGKWSVIEDKVQNVPVQHFTPFNTFGFQGQKSFDEVPEALRVRFINRDKGWLQDERLVYDDTHTAETAERYETLDLTGITSADQAWKDGRYHIATARLRPESYSFYCDIEHIVCTRGDLIRFTHDVPMFGLSSGRVAGLVTNAGNVTAVTLNNDVTMEAGKSYALRFRKSEGASLVCSVQTFHGSGRNITLITPLPVAQGPAPGDLFMFGESGQESVELIVNAIEPQNNLNARISCVDASPAVHTADIAAIPAFSSQISVPPALLRPPTPVLAGIQSGEEALMRHTDGSLTTRIIVSLTPPSWNNALSLEVRIRAQDETDFRPATATSQGATQVSITDIAEQEIYDIQIRYMTPSGVLSAPLLISGHRVTGTAGIPSDVASLSMNVLGDTAHLAWTAVADIDLSHYALRFSPQITGAGWNNAVDIVSSIAMDATSISFPAASGTYLLKAVDVGGNMSTNAAAVVSNIAGLSGYNAVMTVTEHPAFAGSCTNVDSSGGALRLAALDSIDDWSDIDAVPNLDVGEEGLFSTGEYLFDTAADLGAVYTSRLTANIAVEGIDMNAGPDMWSSIDGVEYFDQDVDPALWSVQLQLRMTADDPAGSPGWSSWMPFVVGDYTARAFEFRLLMAAAAANITPAVSQLQVDIDMPDRTAGTNDILSDALGSAILFETPFRATPAIAITAQNMASGDYYTITAPSSTGFTIRFFDSSGTGIVRRFDYLARGYGEEI